MIVWIDTAGLERAEALFGLTPLQRHLRALAKLPQRPTRIVLSGPAPLPADIPAGLAVERQAGEGGSLAQRLGAVLGTAQAPVVALEAGALVDPRLVAHLGAAGAALVARGGTDGEETAALRLLPGMAVPDAGDLRGLADALLADGTAAELRDADFPGFVVKLRRTVPFYLYAPRDAAARARRERWMFLSNYKGSTDVLTRYVYPPLVWPLVRLCVRYGIPPNAVTALSMVLTFAAVPFFAAGQFWIGLAMAYAMTVLDSVDGKVARVTLSDSRIGDIMDHGLDIVHPPLWYCAWAWGLGGRDWSDPLLQAALWLFVFYVADRLVLMVAKARFGRGLHAVGRIDAVLRSFIARRNTNLIVFTVGLALGLPEAAFFVVTGWQGATAAWHTLRTGWLMANPRALAAALAGQATRAVAR